MLMARLLQPVPFVEGKASVDAGDLGSGTASSQQDTDSTTQGRASAYQGAHQGAGHWTRARLCELLDDQTAFVQHRDDSGSTYASSPYGYTACSSIPDLASRCWQDIDLVN